MRPLFLFTKKIICDKMNSVQKENYQKELDDILNGMEIQQGKDGGKKPGLLLHACCAPCSSYVLEYLNRYFDITIYYYNPNIHPEAEYTRRLEELKSFLPKFRGDVPGAEINLIETEYEPGQYFDAVQAERDGLEEEKERGERCRRCYLFRMCRAYEYAVQHEFDWFTTTLSISPFKDAPKINIIGKDLERKNAGTDDFHTKFLTSDFKKRNGFKRSLELSEKYGLYRQDYCGCVYSKRKD